MPEGNVSKKKNKPNKRGFIGVFVRIIESLLIGIISGLIVTYLFLGPKLNIQKFQCDEQGADDVKIIITFQNVGNSPAHDVNLDYIFIPAKDMKNVHPGSIARSAMPIKPIEGGIIDPGDAYEHTLILKKFENEKHYLWICFNYSDPSFFRGFLFKLFGSPLKKIRWAIYNPSRNKLEKIPVSEMGKLDKFKKLISATQEEGFIRENRIFRVE